jgi:capsular exopolysaccharide synthesis family protein
VARLPLVPGVNNARNSEREVSLFEESVDSLRTCLLLGNQGEHVHIIAVASAISGEGKTSVATQLAVSIARATRQPTLIIDADMRSPDVHRIFQMENSGGLASILQSEATLEEALHTEWNDYIHVLPAGRATTNPHTLLNSALFRDLLAECRTKYTHIVIDTPPILLASESLVVAKESDGTLLCTMRDHSRERQVHSACERLRAVGARTLGTVLSGIPSRQYAAKYGNYSYSG